MYWQKSELYTAIRHNDPKIRNFYDTYGVVVIKNFLNKQDFKDILKEYDEQYRTRAGKVTPAKMLINRLGFSGPKQYGFKAIAKAILRRDAMRFLPDFVDSSEKFCNFFFEEERLKVYRYFGGDDFLYLGSDGSHFITTSFPWHRDWYTQMPIMKFNFYFNPLPFLGGRFMVIPGTNFPDDSYSQLVQKSMSWPMQNKFPGGLSENGFLPPIVNPRRGKIDAIKQNILTWIGLQNPMADVPHMSIKLNKGDLIIFDQRLLHCVESTFPKFSRRLLTMLLSKNAFSFSDEHYTLKRGHTRESLMREVVDLVVSERNHINCPAYGDAMYQHPFSKSKNFIRIDEKPKTETDGKRIYDTGSFELPDGKRFTSVLDNEHYANIGAKYREQIGEHQKTSSDTLAQAYSYENFHLGVNAQNVKKISNV